MIKMATNNEYENCWNKHLVVLDKCMDRVSEGIPSGTSSIPSGTSSIPSGTSSIPSGTESIDNDKLEVCYQIFKKNFQQCVGVNAVTNPLYFNKIVK
jgi:hypothetical protein